jgi:acyl-CoA thioester hydrolase
MERQPLSGREAYRHWSTIQTLWADNDVYGHVNNAVHYRWFDTVVNSWLIEHGLLDPQGGGPIGLVVETGCRYAASASFPDPVEIGLTITRIGGSSVNYQLGVFLEGQPDPIAQGHFTHVYVDPDSRRPVSMPDPMRAELEKLLVG